MSRRIPEHTLTVEQQELVRRLIAETQERIHQDYKKAPLRLRPFLLYIKREIFNPEFAIGAARRASGLGSDYSTKFYALTGKRPRDYVEHHRIMLARSIIRYTPMLLWQVGQKVGFNDQSVFTKRYEKVVGHAPKKEGTATESELSQLAGGNLKVSPPDSHTLDPKLSPNTAELGTEPPGLDLARFWDEIEGMNRVEINRHLEHLEVIELDHFHYLLQKAKYEGRKDRERGEELGLAALDALRLVEFRKGREFLDEKAIGYASLGNTCRLRFDRNGAIEAFEMAQKFLRPEPDDKRLIFAEVSFLRSLLLWWERDVQGALRLLDDILPIIRQCGSQELLARALLTGGEIYDSTGHPERAEVLLSEATELSRFVDDSYVVFSAHFNLALVYSKLSKAAEAAIIFEKVQRLRKDIAGDTVRFHVAYLEGMICRTRGDLRNAELLFLEAREGFLNSGLPVYAALVSLDLALLYLDSGNSQAFPAAVSAIPPISEFGAHPEAITALAILQDSEKSQNFNKAVLNKALHHLDLVRKDPTVNFLWKHQ